MLSQNVALSRLQLKRVVIPKQTSARVFFSKTTLGRGLYWRLISRGVFAKGNQFWKSMDSLDFLWLLPKSLWTWTPGRRKHLVIFSSFWSSVLSHAKSEVLVLAPLTFMRVHGTFEMFFHNACDYAYRCAMKKVGGYVRRTTLWPHKINSKL